MVDCGDEVCEVDFVFGESVFDLVYDDVEVE